jgi:hypothetical protein
MTNTEWAVPMGDRQAREARMKEKEMKATLEKHAPLPQAWQYRPGIWGSQGSVSSTTSLSPSSPEIFTEGHGHMSLLWFSLFQ